MAIPQPGHGLFDVLPRQMLHKSEGVQSQDTRHPAPRRVPSEFRQHDVAVRPLIPNATLVHLRAGRVLPLPEDIGSGHRRDLGCARRIRGDDLLMLGLHACPAA
eukprot:CAMPEP_0198565688 /NCGR_PEP_ID=MMETSP1462-20131121/102163_1 /TAXON_ID=1333877 /ORGANISM="Brandtodinium nutriculum, Strain RCC3387" /LENGTH=103 /DNA_ID=CAMNT_0044296691 /DNA_START=77 /DNA_END=385 /DNA_ORIENTATION=+